MLPSTWDTLFQDLSHGLPLPNYSHGYKRLRAMSLFIKTVLYALNRHFTAEQVKYFLTLLKVHTDLPKTTKQVSSFKCFLINFAQIFPIHYKLKCLQKKYTFMIKCLHQASVTIICVLTKLEQKLACVCCFQLFM